jgi:uncharacterized protein
MTPSEQKLIEDLFNRIRSLGLTGHDAEADALINRLMQQTPDAAYALVQSVLVQDQALREAHQRIQALEERQSADSAGSSFLGTPVQQRWGRSPTGPSVPPPSAAQPQAAYSALPQESQAGGFMRGALQTAAGVAGGALLFEGVRSLLSGGSGFGGLGGHAGSPWGNPDTVVNETINETTINDDGRERSDRSDVQLADDSGQDDATSQDWDDDTDSFDDSSNSV